MSAYDHLYGSTQNLSQSLSAFVYHYGIAEAIARNTDSPGVALNDFFHYCVAKGSKHIRAALVLVENEFPEDAIVLSRAAYECYVSAAYAKAQGLNAIDDLVYNPVGLSAGTVHYAQTKTGGLDYRRLVDRRTEECYRSPPSIEKMVLSTGYEADAVVHRYYYGFSSQHAHVHMAGSGNYRDGTSYTDEGNEQRPNAVFLTAYATIVLMGLARAVTQMDEDEKSRIERELRAAVIHFNDVLDQHIKNLSDEFVQGVRSRLARFIE